MALTTTFCVSGAVLAKAGQSFRVDGIPDVGTDEYAIDSWIQEAESYINVLTRFNWLDAHATLNADVKLILQEAASNMAAIYAIQYDMSTYPSRKEAEDMIKMLWDRFRQLIDVLKDQKAVTYTTGA